MLTAKECPYTGPFASDATKLPSHGATVRALKRAMARLGYIAWKQNFTEDWPAKGAFDKGFRKWQLKRGLAADGVYGEKSWQAIRAARVASGMHKGQYALDRFALEMIRQEWRAQQVSPEDEVRKALVAFCHTALDHSSKWNYYQYRPVPVTVDPARPPSGDCSSSVIWAYHWARRATGHNVPDPAKQGYTGYGNCMEPSARILTTDLLWVAAGDIEVGDEVWAFDAEFDSPGWGNGQQGRQYRRAVVTASFLAKKECVRVHFASGESHVCSVDHPWLSRGLGMKSWKWREAQHLLPTHKGRGGKAERYCLRPFIPWKRLDTWEAGWVAGMLDGEGHVGGSHGVPSHIGITQAVGSTATALMEALPKYADWNIAPKSGSRGVREQIGMQTNGGGLPVAISLLGRVGAKRLIERFDIDGAYMQARLPEQSDRVVAVEPVGMCDIQSITTDVGTYFAEGYAVHNTDYFEDDHPTVHAPYKVGDLAHYSGHVTMCMKGGDRGTSEWFSFGSEPPRCLKLDYRSDFRKVVRPPLLEGGRQATSLKRLHRRILNPVMKKRSNRPTG